MQNEEKKVNMLSYFGFIGWCCTLFLLNSFCRKVTHSDISEKEAIRVGFFSTQKDKAVISICRTQVWNSLSGWQLKFYDVGKSFFSEFPFPFSCRLGIDFSNGSTWKANVVASRILADAESPGLWYPSSCPHYRSYTVFKIPLYFPAVWSGRRKARNSVPEIIFNIGITKQISARIPYQWSKQVLDDFSYLLCLSSRLLCEMWQVICMKCGKIHLVRGICTPKLIPRNWSSHIKCNAFPARH